MKTDVQSVEELREIVLTQATRITELEALVNYFEELFRLSKHRQFGASSEKSEYDQLGIFNEVEASADENIPEPELTVVDKHFRKRTRLVTDKLPDDLPVEEVFYDLPESDRDCPECGSDMHIMGRNTARRELKIIPAKVSIVEHVQLVYACRTCEKDEAGVPVMKAELCEPVIKGSFAAPETIAHIMTQSL